MENTFIITAGGIGKRMGSAIPKQFLELKGLPILMHTLRNFHAFDSSAQLLLTLPKDWLDTWSELCHTHSFKVPHELITGGIERFDSIKNALSLATGNYIWIHDGVRPLVSHETLNRCKMGLTNHSAIVPVLPLKESLRWHKGEENKAVTRSEYVLVQTPQCFHQTIIQNAYQQEYSSQFTDDASVVENTNVPIHLVEGNEENIKITSPMDLKIASLFLTQA
jgi:2-C-methyl-D-erythritol 4-phosphate cytidylyltransferase